MRLDFALLISTASLLATPAAAVTIAFHVAYSCAISASWTITNANNNCYVALSNMGAVYFTGLPSGTKGQIYGGTTSACTNYLGERGSGSGCVISGSGPVRSANWFYPWKKLVRKDGLETLGPERHSVTYSLPNLTTREVEIPANEVARALKYVEERNYEALAEYPTVSTRHLSQFNLLRMSSFIES